MEKTIIDGVEVEVLRNYYTSGEINQEWTQTRYDLHGYRKSYYKTGQLKEHQEYRRGAWIGIDTRYFENGCIQQKVTKINDFLFQIQVWHLNGQEKEKFNVNEKKVHVGNEYRWFDNGLLELAIEFSDSIFKNGTYQSCYVTGHDRLEAKYIGGIFHVVTFFNEQLVQTLKDGTGIIRTLKDGVLKAEDTYINGLRNGICRIYDKSGYLKNESDFINGKSNGKSTWYNADGTVKEIIYMENDVMVKKEIPAGNSN